jgi:hypothetical protein
LILGIENDFNLDCYHISVFVDFDLIVNMVIEIYTPSTKFLKRYTHVVWYLILNFLSFNITHIRRELNSMADRIVIFATNPTRKLMPQRPNCTLIYLCCPHFPNNVESWKFFLDDKIVCAFLQNEPIKRKEIISLEDNKFPKGLNPINNSFSSSDVGNKKYIEEEE